jgi:hypothetical protein
VATRKQKVKLIKALKNLRVQYLFKVSRTTGISNGINKQQSYTVSLIHTNKFSLASSTLAIFTCWCNLEKNNKIFIDKIDDSFKSWHASFSTSTFAKENLSSKTCSGKRACILTI